MNIFTIMNNIDALKDILSAVLYRWGSKYQQQLKGNLDKLGKVDTGTLKASIRFSVDELQLEVNMVDYARFVHYGRGPGKFPPVDAIRGWVERKGLTIQGSSAPLETQQRQLTYLIGRKIATVGIDPSPFIDDLPIDEIADELVAEIGDWLVANLFEE